MIIVPIKTEHMRQIEGDTFTFFHNKEFCGNLKRYCRYLNEVSDGIFIFVE